MIVAGGVVVWAAASAVRRALDARLRTTEAELRRLGDSSAWRGRGEDEVRREVVAFRGTLEDLRAREEERRVREEEGWAVLQRVAAVLSGGQRAGRAGEQVLRRAHAEAYRQGVIIIPYSMALPVVLFLHSIVSRFGMGTDVESCLSDLAGVLDSLEGVLENKLARASTMLANGTEELRGQMGKARSTLARAHDRASD